MDMFCQCDLPIHWSLTALLRNADSWLRSLQIFQLYSHNQGFLCRSKHQFGGWSVIMSSLLAWRKKGWWCLDWSSKIISQRQQRTNRGTKTYSTKILNRRFRHKIKNSIWLDQVSVQDLWGRIGSILHPRFKASQEKWGK